MENKIKVLAIGDGVTPTGFARVMHAIFGRLSKKNYEIHHLAINYHGDPHNLPYRVYPAVIGGDVYGINRIKNFVELNPDIIFILNDLWIINEYLKEIKKVFTKIPKIVVYYPVDAKNLDPDWFINFDIVSQAVTYTRFGQNCTLEANENIKTRIITHGVDTNIFYKLDSTKEEIKKLVFPDREDFQNSFIVLNAN